MSNAPNPVLVEKYRGNTLESFHRGAVCIVDASGEIIFSAGNPRQIIFPRSALKFAQQIPLIEAAVPDTFNLTDEEVALTLGSHNGEEMHCRNVRNILDKAGLDESALQCGAQPPTLKEDRLNLLKQGGKPRPVHNNCSGKHAGFLALTKALGHDVSTYLKPDHPVQTIVKNAVAELHEYDRSAMDVAKDGCSAPIFSIPLYNMAIGFKNLIFPDNMPPHRQRACKKITSLITAYPLMIAGHKRYCTDVMQLAGDKLLAKTGADGVFALACPVQGWSAAVKIDDGAMGPQYAVAQEIINRSGILNEEETEQLNHYREVTIKTWSGIECGRSVVNESVFDSWKIPV